MWNSIGWNTTVYCWAEGKGFFFYGTHMMMFLIIKGIRKKIAFIFVTFYNNLINYIQDLFLSVDSSIK